MTLELKKKGLIHTVEINSRCSPLASSGSAPRSRTHERLYSNHISTTVSPHLLTEQVESN